VAGLAFQTALMPVKVLDSVGEGSFFDVADGIDYAVDFQQKRAASGQVINLSLGGPGGSETLSRAVSARSRGASCWSRPRATTTRAASTSRRRCQA
jgi:subtilisin family serine protease